MTKLYRNIRVAIPNLQRENNIDRGFLLDRGKKTRVTLTREFPLLSKP